MLVDGDRPDYLKTVQQAAEDDEICGGFFVSKPDFELGNFSHDELEELLWEKALELGADFEERQHLHDAISSSKSGEELLQKARSAIPALNTSANKGSKWGEALMEYSVRTLPQDTDGADNQLRLIHRAIQRVLNTAYFANYRISRQRLRVDPHTGEAIKRI